MYIYIYVHIHIHIHIHIYRLTFPDYFRSDEVINVRLERRSFSSSRVPTSRAPSSRASTSRASSSRTRSAISGYICTYIHVYIYTYICVCVYIFSSALSGDPSPVRAHPGREHLVLSDICMCVYTHTRVCVSYVYVYMYSAPGAAVLLQFVRSQFASTYRYQHLYMYICLYVGICMHVYMCERVCLYIYGARGVFICLIRQCLCAKQC